MISNVPRRRATRRGLLAVVAASLLAPLAVAQPTGAGPATAGTAGHIAAAAATTFEDHSNSMPRTARNEVVGSFVGSQDQRAVVELNANTLTESLNIYDSAEQGGSLIRSSPTDLGSDLAEDLWDDKLRDYAQANGLGRVPLAWTPDALFIAGVNRIDGGNMLARVKSDGSCAQFTCMDLRAGGDWVQDLPDSVFPSTIAAGTIGTTAVVAVGMTDVLGSTTPGQSGVLVFNQADGTFLGSWQPLGTHGGAHQTTVTALDWDDTGSGLLAVGTTQSDPCCVRMQAVRVTVNGSSASFTENTFYETAPGTTTVPSPLSVAVGHRVDGSPVIAFGMDDGTVKLWDPATSSTALLSQATGSTSDPIDALTFTDRIDGTTGVPDLVAVSSRGDTARVLRYSGASTLSPLPVTGNGGTTSDVGGIRAWFPGYKTGFLIFSNSTVSDPAIQLDFAARPNAGYGCWFDQDFDPPALPTDPVIVPQGGTSISTIAFLTAGDDGSCAAGDVTGQWAAYVTLTPLGRPADRTVAKLVWNRSGEVTVQSVGGSLELTVEGPGQDSKVLGGVYIDIQSPPPPGAPASLGLKGTRLDPAGTDRPVYRFDLAATTWQLPASTPPRLQTVLPPLKVYGCFDDGGCSDLGLLVPQGQPSRATSGSVTLSPVSFYWQDPPTGPPLDAVYVYLGDLESDAIVLDDLPAPPAPTNIGELVVCPISGTTKCDATADPVTNGMDQAKLLIQVRDDNAQVLPLTDPAYGRIYYRDVNGDLLTGLIPVDGSAYTRVSPYAGAYPNDNSTTTPVRPPANGTVGGRNGYLSTTTSDDQEITAYVGGFDEGSSSPIIVQALDFTPQVQAGAQAGPGFYVTGCTDYRGNDYCRLAQITATKPGLFLTYDPDTGEPRIGLQFATTAQTSLTSLPLQQVAGEPEHTVAARPLTVNNGEVHLNSTAGFQPADAIDTWLISHGSQVEIRDVRVGGGN